MHCCQILLSILSSCRKNILKDKNKNCFLLSCSSHKKEIILGLDVINSCGNKFIRLNWQRIQLMLFSRYCLSPQSYINQKDILKQEIFNSNKLTKPPIFLYF